MQEPFQSRVTVQGTWLCPATTGLHPQVSEAAFNIIDNVMLCTLPVKDSYVEIVFRSVDGDFITQKDW